ncbi:MAG: hypothetical protein WD934_04510 [Gemmatimonadales bacterium]
MLAARLRRLHATLLLATYLATGGVALWGEARLEAADATPTHVEEAGQHPCDIGHDHDRCLVCRSLSSVGLPMSGTTTAPPGLVADAPVPTDPSTASGRSGLRLPASRAPPALVCPV